MVGFVVVETMEECGSGFIVYDGKKKKKKKAKSLKFMQF